MLNLHINGTNIDNQLKQFWELEEIPFVKDKTLTSVEQFVETYFQNTYACNSDGRFVVKLPFYKSNSELGDSKPAAISRLLAMERKFKSNPDFEKQYKEFMNEYKSLGHMSLVNSSSHTSKDQNFLPHYAIIKPSSSTTKLRVAFDASCKTTNDASSLAYAAAIYCRQKHNSKIKVQLLVSKTKVAPVKQVLIPRLELCAAHLLSKLFKSVLWTLKHYTFDVFAWTDSKIVLSWLSSHPRKWKTFVANRISEIMEVLPTKHWRHVPSKENPADIASRGIDPKCLPDCMLWWQGPPWLRLETSSWPKAESGCDEASNEEEIQSIKKQISLPPKSPLRSLYPFIDQHGLVRVGGRLQNSQLRFNSKHPIILPSQHIVYIEAFGDLTADSFIAALRRFSARRGAPRHIYNDNGTNFVGAHRKLDEIRKLWLSLPTNEAISYYLSKSSIDRHFIPPSSPHFGGIWESGIRSVKFHLKRVLGETILTFEELIILLTQIEGLLNSRPLSYVNDSDIECISTLTPSHFLTGVVLLSVPEELPSTSNHRNRWELLQNIKRGFWKQWSANYLSSLQPRKKWQDVQPNLKEVDIVLIKEEGPPGTWPMARVLQVHPGNDGLVRVATVKIQESVLKRPVHKLHKLPIYPS
ncbi:pao retrotransposon peptidase superfamily [Trichonephila clavipes]|nr:pao retrotransposon peptidase superfamily [Trichonephila clavipes]